MESLDTSSESSESLIYDCDSDADNSGSEWASDGAGGRGCEGSGQGSGCGNEIRTGYRSPVGCYFVSRKAVLEFLAGPRTANEVGATSMDESGSEYFPMPRKGRQLPARLE